MFVGDYLEHGCNFVSQHMDLDGRVKFVFCLVVASIRQIVFFLEPINCSIEKEPK